MSVKVQPVRAEQGPSGGYFNSSLMTGGVLIADGGTNLTDANGAAISVVFLTGTRRKVVRDLIRRRVISDR
jgi:hypothetical protein